MRLLLGLALLVIVLATVAGLVKSQLQGLSASGVMPVVVPAPAPGAPSTLSSPGAPAVRTAPVVEEMKRAMEAGTAARASEPER